MNIYFYLFLIFFFLTLLLIFKIINLKKEIKNITKSFTTIINTDTNNLITLNSNDLYLKNLTSTLNKSLKKLRHLKLKYQNDTNKLKTSLINISHDLRTPLTAIRGYLDLMNKENFTSKQLSYFTTINEKVQELIELTAELFTYTKAQNETFNYKTLLCLNTYLENSLISFYSLFNHKNITPQITICSKKIIISINENILKRILENIISNALKYSEEDFKVTLTTTGTLTFSNRTSNLKPTTIKKIFSETSTIQDAQKTSGLGLSIAKQLVKLSDGTISASIKNNYLTIKIKLPILKKEGL